MVTYSGLAQITSDVPEVAPHTVAIPRQQCGGDFGTVCREDGHRHLSHRGLSSGCGAQHSFPAERARTEAAARHTWLVPGGRGW